MDLDKKQLERHYLDRFLSLLLPPLQGSIEPSEEPDFLVRNRGDTLGIEITELHRAHSGEGRPPQADQAMRERVIDRAKEAYEAAKHPPVHVSVFFNDYHPVQKRRVDELANAIVRLVVRNMPELSSSRHEQYDWVSREYFPEELHEVSVHRYPSLTRPFFNAPGATWIADLEFDDVQRVLDAKEEKYEAYLKRCSSAWLLINCDSRFMSTWFEFSSEVVSGIFRSSFDRVFLLRHIANQVHELRLQRGHTC